MAVAVVVAVAVETVEAVAADVETAAALDGPHFRPASVSASASAQPQPQSQPLYLSPSLSLLSRLACLAWPAFVSFAMQHQTPWGPWE